MYRVLLLCLWLPSTAMAVVVDSEIWINELHYDNAGADENEFVEVAAPAGFTDLSNVTLTLYNGNGGQPYGGTTNLDSFSVSETVDGYTFYAHDISLQNGAPDGLALTHESEVLQFLSYEGQFSATAGPANTLLSTDIGVEETPSTPLGLSLQLAGTGDSYLDFSWQSPAPHTRGTLNQAQSVVPEPSSLLLGLTLAMVSVLCWRRWRPNISRGMK
ncbi:MAG: PEP-CTERM sorting domain-containing protein [Planctomycetota bacterium]